MCLPCACLELPAVFFVCVFCRLILAVQPAGIRITLQGTETSAWHPKNALAGSLQPRVGQGWWLDYSWLSSGSGEAHFQSSAGEFRDKQGKYKTGRI